MSDSISAYYDDCEEWESIRRSAGIHVNWDVYSSWAAYAMQGYRERKLVGDKLLRYVEKCIARDVRKRERQQEREEYKLYLKLKKKFAHKEKK